MGERLAGDGDHMTGQPKPVSQLEQLEEEVDRTRAEYQAAAGEERDRLWDAHQRALRNWNTAVAQANQRASTPKIS